MARNIVFKVTTDTSGVRAGMEQATQATEKAKKSVSELDKALSNVGNAISNYFSLDSIKNFAVAVFNISKEMQSLNVRMTGLYADANKANQALANLRETADKLGMDFMTMTNNYVQFVGAAKASGMEVSKAEKIFKSMSIAIAGSGASAETANRAMTALQQMIGKGKISAEELRGQLGEALPSAFGIMAKSLGVTTAQLDKMMASGQLMANDVLPKFAKEMEKAFGSNAQAMAEGMQGNMARLKNAWEGYMTSLGERFYGNGGGAEVLTDMLNWWTKINESQEQYFRRESARLSDASLEKKIAEDQLETLRARGETAEKMLETFKRLKASEMDYAKSLKLGGDEAGYLVAVKTASAYDEIVKSLKEEIRLKNVKTPLSEAEIKRIEKQKEAYRKLKQEMEKAMKDIFKVDFANMPESQQEGAFPGALGESAKREARIKEAKITEEFQKDLRRLEIKQQEREIADFKKKEQEKTEIAKQQQELRKQNEVALYSGLASTAVAWGQRELTIQQQNLDKRREQGVISEEAYLNQLKAIKRKQFMLDKLGAVAQIAINTGVALSSPTNVLGALTPQILAQGAIATGLVLAQPIPYKKGTKRVPMVRGAVRGEDSVHAILTPNERVVPESINIQPGYSALLDLAQDRKISDKEAGFLAEVATSGMRPMKSEKIDPDEFGKAVAKHIPHTDVRINERGIAVITERSQHELRRLKTRL